MFFDRHRNEEWIVGEVVLVGTFHDNFVDQRVAIIKISSEFSSKRYKENAEGDWVIDTSIPAPQTPDAYVYQFLGAFGAPEFESLDEAKWWAKHAPRGPAIWDR